MNLEKLLNAARSITPDRFSPTRLLLTLVAVVYLVELLVMTMLGVLTTHSTIPEAFLDATVLVVVLYPVLYFTVFRPMTGLLESYRIASQELAFMQKHLEEIVEQRTHRLNQLIKQRDEDDELAAHSIARYSRARYNDPRVEYFTLPASRNFCGDVVMVARSANGGVNIMMVDAVGHGLPAAINLLPAIQMFYTMTLKGLDLGTIITEINDRLHELMPPGRFLAATVLNLDAAEGRVTGWIGANPKVYVVNPDGAHIFPSENLALGILPSAQAGMKYFTAAWTPTSVLATCTDGVLDVDGCATGEDADWFCDTLLRNGPRMSLRLLNHAWRKRSGTAPVLDDATMLVINETRNEA